MRLSEKPHIHLWIYNHPFYGISDQIEFFISSFKQNGYLVTIGRQPNASSLNFVVENFSKQTKDILKYFCMNTRKRVAVIMTEHMDFDDGQLFIHGDPLWSNNDYMHPSTQISRITNFIECKPYIQNLFVLGDLPELRNISTMLPGIGVRSIPFPNIHQISTNGEEKPIEITQDLLFTGVITKHRAAILAKLKANSFSISCPRKFVSRKKRDMMNRKVKMVLNIPQRIDWQWLSLMRIFAALRCGRATLSLGTNDESQIAICCHQLDLVKQGWIDELKWFTSNWELQYLNAIKNYNLMAEKYQRSHPFPHDILEFWAITDRL